MNSPTPSCAGIVGEGFGNSKQLQPKVVAEKREAEDGPDYLRELLAPGGHRRAGIQRRRQVTGDRHRKSFGSRRIEQALPGQLQGEA